MKREPKYQEIVFAIEDYKWGNSIEQAREEMWKDINTQLQLLLKTGHNALVRADETDIIVIEYGYDEQIKQYGCDQLMWVTAEEAESIYDNREIIFTDGKKEYTADEDGTLYEETVYDCDDKVPNCDPDGFAIDNYRSDKNDDYDYYDGPDTKKKLKVKPFKETLAKYPSLKIKK